MRRIPILAIVIASLWIGASYVADKAHTKEMTKSSVSQMTQSLNQLNPWLLSTSFLERAACGASGGCRGCSDPMGRFTAIDCGPMQGPAREKSVSVIFLLVLSAPIAALFALKQALRGGWLVFIPAVGSWILAYSALLFYDRRFGRKRGWQLDLGARLVWSFPLAALLEWIFQLAFTGALILLGNVLSFMAFLFYPLLALEVYSKLKHSSEFVEKAGASRS